MTNKRVCWGETMRALFLKLYTLSLLAVLISMAATFYLLWYQWQPENNYNLKRFSEPALRHLVKDLKERTKNTQSEVSLKINKIHLPVNNSELEQLRLLSAQMHGLVSLIFERDLEFSKEELRSLKQKQIIYRNTIETKVAYLSYDKERVLELELTRLKGSATHWMASAIYLAHYSPGNLEEKLQYLQLALSEYEPKPIIQALNQAQLSQSQLARLVVMPQAYSRLTSSNYRIYILHQPFASSDQAKLISFEVNLAASLWLPPVTFLPVLSILLGIFFWFSLRPYINKTCQLSKVTQRFSEGDLNARVGLEGYSPIDKLAQQFDHAADHVQQLLQSQNTLLKAVAHELRTPIAKLFFYGELLSATNDEEQKQQLLQDYHSSVEDLSKLTNELLTNHHYRSGRITLDMSIINLSQIVMSECRESVYINTAIKLELNCTNEVHIWGEEQPVRRVLTNLINNANRHADSQIKVSLNPSVQAEYDGWVEIWVEDDGVGVPLDQRTAIFDLFYRVDESRNRQSGGLGLGLSITKQIIKALGGHITVDQSQTLGGARFITLLPTQQS